ncbi:F-box domain-containing protein [Salix suchowensis]|nr:F-box domain-containing protein [Salix suchowensis]
MSLVQLEHAATTPFRFTSLLRHSSRSQKSLSPTAAANSTSSSSAQPVAIRLLQPRLPRDFAGDIGIFESSYLVPGGRFLLTRSSRNLLQVWDLGYSADMMIKPESVASHHLGDGELQFDPDAQITQDGEGLLVFLASENVFRIFEVYPLSESPSFRKVASIDVVLGGRCVYVFTSTLIIFYMNRRLTVWDYVEDNILSCKSRGQLVLVYLRERQPARSLRCSRHRASYRTPEAASSSGSSYIYSLNNPSYSDPDVVDSDSLDDDNTGTNGGEALIIARYTLKKVKNHPRDGLPEYMPVLVEHVRLGGHLQPNVDNARSIRTGSRDLVLMWPSMQGKKLLVYYSDLEGSGQTTGEYL